MSQPQAQELSRDLRAGIFGFVFGETSRDKDHAATRRIGMV